MDRIEETAHHFKKSLKIAQHLGTSPYKWSDERNVEFAGHGSLRYLFFVAQMTLYLTYESFVIFRWIWFSFCDPNATPKEKSALQYVAFSYSIPVMCHLCSFFNADQLHHFINRLLLYHHGTCQSKTVIEFTLERLDLLKCPSFSCLQPLEIAGAEEFKQKRFGPSIRIVMAVGIAVISLNTVSLFLCPTAPHLLTSLIPGVGTLQKWKLIPVAMLQCYIWCTQWSSIYFYCTFFLAHICTAQNGLEILR